MLNPGSFEFENQASQQCPKAVLPDVDLPNHTLPLDLVSVLLQNDAYQLTARSNTCLRKQLLESRFDRALGDSDPRRDFFTCETVEHE